MKKKSKNKWIVIGIIVVLLVGIIGSAMMKPKDLNYESATANIADISTYHTFSGNVETKNRQTVMSDKLMQVSEIMVEEGDVVEDGDNLIKTTTSEYIKAKIDGVITSVSVQENSQVMAGVKLLEIVDTNNLEISIKVDEYDISYLEVGKNANINIPAIDKTVQGELKSISEEGKITDGVTFFTVKIDLQENDNVKIGMTAEAKFNNKNANGVVTLPVSAINFNDEDNSPYIFKKDEKGNMIKTNIETGINDGSIVEIKSGVLNNEIIYYQKTSNLMMTPTMGTSKSNNSTSSGGVNSNA